MSFGSSNDKPRPTPAAPYTPKSPMGSVLLAGLSGLLKPTSNPALSTSFAGGSTSGLGRRPALSKRTIFGGM